MKKASAVTLLILIGILTCCLGAFGCSALIGLSSVIGWFFALLLLTGHITGAAYAFRLFKTRRRLGEPGTLKFWLCTGVPSLAAGIILKRNQRRMALQFRNAFRYLFIAYSVSCRFSCIVRHLAFGRTSCRNAEKPKRSPRKITKFKPTGVIL